MDGRSTSPNVQASVRESQGGKRRNLLAGPLTGQHSTCYSRLAKRTWFRDVNGTHPRSQHSWEHCMDDSIIYDDKLITIFPDSILFKNYYLFSIGSKRIRFDRIRTITVDEPTLFTGKWRFQGSGDLRTWFPFDSKRPKRDKIFTVTFLEKRTRIGFTVEDSNQVLHILREKGLT